MNLTFTGLPQGFAPAKPLSTGDYMARNLVSSGHVVMQRKHDGQRIYAVVLAGGVVKLYSRGRHDMTAHLPVLAAHLASLHIPPHSLLDGELFVDRQGQDDFLAVSGLLRSLPDRGAGLEQQTPVRYAVFDLLYLGTEPWWLRPYKFRYARLGSLLPKMDRAFRVPLEPGAWDTVRDRAVTNQWEGIILWDLDDRTHVRFDDHPSRTNCYRWKPEKEDDFVATGFKPGQGKHRGRAGSLIVGQYVGDTFTLMGSVGTGLNDQEREEALSWSYPVVVTCAYGERSDSGTLRFPRFLRRREDKLPEECLWVDTL